MFSSVLKGVVEEDAEDRREVVEEAKEEGVAV